ncbi:MAG: hypothetical protein LKE40_03585 [Spirochaetia bacterium]|nr:hypothetical protein [Spirochaetia bacterium]
MIRNCLLLYIYLDKGFLQLQGIFQVFCFLEQLPDLVANDIHYIFNITILLKNHFILTYFNPDSGFTTHTFRTILWMLPFLAVGIAIGETIHKKADQRTFSIMVFALLFVTGIFMLVLR